MSARRPLAVVTWTRARHALGLDTWRSDTGCTAIVTGLDFDPSGWHLSVSHPERYPSYDELASARDALVPDTVTMGMIFPRPADYVNVHQTTLHLWQFADDHETAPRVPRT